MALPRERREAPQINCLTGNLGKTTPIDLQWVSGTPPKPTGPPENGSAAQAGNRDGAKQKGERAALSDKKYDGAGVSSTGLEAPRRETPTLQQKIARKYASETPAQRAYHLEIARRYAWSDDDRANVQKFPKLRLRSMERLFAKRWGPTLPDDDCGRDCLVVAADHIVQYGNPLKHIPAWVALWAPWLTSDELALLIDNAISRRKYWSAAALGRELRLTEEERRILKITTIRPYNVTKAGMVKKARFHKRASDTARRRRAGAVPRADYEGQSAARNKPWEALGISRATWHRRGKPVPPDDTASTQRPARQVRETSPRGAEERYAREATRLTMNAATGPAADRSCHGGNFDLQAPSHLPQPPEGKDQVAKSAISSALWGEATSPPTPLMEPETRLARVPATGLSCSRARDLP